jgi:hypothetical protein
MDRFPEAFQRFEEVVDVAAINSFGELRLAFSLWAGEKWFDTSRQLHALSIEAQKLGLLPRPILWRYETVRVRGRIRSRYRDIRTGRFVRKR